MTDERTHAALADEVRHHIAICAEDDLGYAKYAPEATTALSELARRLDALDPDSAPGGYDDRRDNPDLYARDTDPEVQEVIAHV